MRYRINWTERVGYYAYIEAENVGDAREQFLAGGMDDIEPCGFCETDHNSIEVVEDK